MKTKSTILNLHNKAKMTVQKLQHCEAELLELLREIDKEKLFRHFERPSLYQYCVQDLGLSGAVALNYITVARRSHQVPELIDNIQSGSFSISHARKISAIITAENKEEWIEKAKKMSCQELELEINGEAPITTELERVKKIGRSRYEVKLILDGRTQSLLNKAQSLASDKKRSSLSLAETIEILAKEYVSRHAPEEKLQRSLARAAKKAEKGQLLKRAQQKVQKEHVSRHVLEGNPSKKPCRENQPEKSSLEKHVSRHVREVGHVSRHTLPRKPLPSSLRVQVLANHGNQCSFIRFQGERCQSSRWLEVHHRVPVSHGGSNDLENLTVLCSAHHKHLHEENIGI